MKDIGVFASRALISPEDPILENQVINLAEGDYDLESTPRSIQDAQGYNPWLAKYTPTVSRRLLPHDLRMLFTCELSALARGKVV